MTRTAASGAPLSSRDWTVIAVLAAAGVVIHGWFALGADALDTDRALVLLMARHFAEGEWSVYFWQQNYMGALEPLLLTPLALVGKATPVAASFVALVVSGLLAWLCTVLARRLGGAWWLTLLLWAIPPAVVVHHHVALYGARLVATLLAVVAFVWALAPPTRRGWVGVGVLTGLAYFGDHLMLPWAIGVMWLAARVGSLRPVMGGALPLVALDTVAAVLTPAVHLSGPNDPGSWLGNIPLLFGATFPQLFGLLLSRGPTPLFQEPASLVPTGLWWPLTAIPGIAVLLALGATLVRRRQELFGSAGGVTGRTGQALALVLAAHIGVFALAGGGGDVWPARYLVPLWPALSILAGLAAARWTARLRPLAAVVALPALFTLAVDDTWPRGRDGTPAVADAQEVSTVVTSSGVEAVWADYWDAYRMALLVGESPPWLPLRIIERRPDWLEAARSARPAGYLVREDDRELLSILEDSRDAGLALLEDRPVGSFRWIVTERPVPEVILRSPPPPRGWQMLAALSAGLTFLLAAAGVQGLSWFLSGRGREHT